MLCDRYVDSSLAYQGVAPGPRRGGRPAAERVGHPGVVPRPRGPAPPRARGRACRASPSEGDRFETEDESFHAKVADAYLHLAEEHPERFAVIDADAPPEVVHERVREAVQPFLAERDAEIAEDTARAGRPNEPVPVLRSVPAQDEAIGFLELAAAAPTTPICSPAPRARASSSRRARSSPRWSAPRGGAGSAATAGSPWTSGTPTSSVVEPEGRDIRVDAIREQVWTPAHRTAPEPGRKVFVIREADRLNPAAADVLLKVLEEPPSETVLLLLSARPEELPETIRSRCHTVTFHPLPEAFVVDALVREGVGRDRAVLSARLAGSNLGRARRLARDRGGLAFRAAALEASRAVGESEAGPLAAAETLLGGTAAYRKGLKEEMAAELEPMMNPDTGRPDEPYVSVVKRVQEKYHRRDRRAEREFLDWSLLALQAWYRDVLAARSGVDPADLINVDLADEVATHAQRLSAPEVARAMEALEEARAALADETNLNPRLILEEAFLRLA